MPEDKEDRRRAGELWNTAGRYRVTVNQGAVSPCNARESNEVQPLRLG